MQQCKKIEPEANGNHPDCLPKRQIFLQHHQVVTKIELGFPGIAFGQGASTYMVNYRIRAIRNSISQMFESPAQINFLHMCKKICIKASGLIPTRFSYKKSCSGRPEHITIVIILTLVFFGFTQQTPPAKWKPKSIDIPSGCTGMFKLVALMEGKNLGLGGGNVRISLHPCDHGFYPSWRHLHIRIEQDQVIGINSF